MKSLDRFIQKLRINKANIYIPSNSRVLDIGCADGALFLQIPNKIREGIGIDPGIQNNAKGVNFRLIRGSFPDDIPSKEANFDVITMLKTSSNISIVRVY
jgi:2-polyprenyl-3-methyl-5-hydroxy-6-metoxy-1,4-benzoquinol methylase